jgi:hypothetical protein
LNYGIDSDDGNPSLCYNKDSIRWKSQRVLSDYFIMQILSIKPRSFLHLEISQYIRYHSHLTLTHNFSASELVLAINVGIFVTRYLRLGQILGFVCLLGISDACNVNTVAAAFLVIYGENVNS